MHLKERKWRVISCEEARNKIWQLLFLKNSNESSDSKKKKKAGNFLTKQTLSSVVGQSFGQSFSHIFCS
jgi:hypothetical protein